MLWGAVFSGGAAAVTSILLPMPDAPAVDTLPAPVPRMAPVDEDTGALIPPSGPSDSGVEAIAGSGRSPDAPAPERVAGLPDGPASRPEIPGVASALNPPPSGASAPELGQQPDRPDRVPSELARPVLTTPETDATISIDPAQPAPARPTAPGIGAGDTDQDSVQIAAATDAGAPLPRTGPARPALVDPVPGTAPDTPPSPEALAVPDPQPDPEPELDQTVTPQPAQIVAATAVPPDPVPGAAPRTDTPATNAGPQIGTVVVPLTERSTGTRLATLGSLGARAQSDPVTPEPVAAPQKPIDAFAVPFENTGDKPLMAIVLMDDDAAIGAEALSEFPYPLTFAVDMAAADATEKMARHRANGFEVVAMTDLPVTASAADAEVFLQAGFDAVPESVALMEGTGSGFQGTRTLSDQVTAILNATGHGLITQDNGLNTVQKLAAREGVPSAVVFRDFDGAGQTPTVMRRFLDQAAFRAGQEGAVIMLGRVRPDTVSALLLWGLQDRATRVALAPVSAVLKYQPS